jgi:hypothetical protein
LPNLKEESDLVKIKNVKDEFEKISAPAPTFNELINSLRLNFNSSS